MLKRLDLHFHLSGAFWRDRLISLTTIFSFLINAVSWYVLWKVTIPKQEFIPIHYSISIGIDRVGSWSELFFMPAVGFGVLLVNTIFAWLSAKELRLARVLVLGTLVVQVMIAISVVYLVMQFL